MGRSCSTRTATTAARTSRTKRGRWRRTGFASSSDERHRDLRGNSGARGGRGGRGLMRAAVVEAIGSPPTPAEFDDPARGAGSALVAVEAAPLNPVEIRVAAGRHPRRANPPYVPGLEGAGTVVVSARVAPGTR